MIRMNYGHIRVIEKWCGIAQTIANSTDDKTERTSNEREKWRRTQLKRA
jgi:glycogen synthase